jgi:protein-disulfide isomerase
VDPRRQRLLQLPAAGAVLAVLAVVVVVVVIIVVSSGSDKGDDPPIRSEQGEVGKLLSGIPQNGMLLGKPGAPVKVYEFGDLQCPFCRANAEEVTPEVIESQVRDGEANLQSVHHRPGVRPGRRSGLGGGRPEPSLELHRALLPQPG